VAGIYSNVNVSGVSKAYVNGSQVYSVPVPQDVKVDLTRAACIGAWLPGDPRFFDGRIDDLRIYDSVLSESQIKQLAGFATLPVPNDGATEVSIESSLSWQAGEGALSYDVYFDTSNPPTTLIADDIPDAICDPGLLDFNTTYYWQVDANTAAGTKTGDVWSFSTAWLKEPVGTVFTFQGRLLDDNSEADGVYDFQFKLFDSAYEGYSEQQGYDVNRPGVDVIDGYFTVELDFGNVFFTGEARWLEIGVRPGGSSDAYETLRPRQRLTGVPYALREQKQIANLQKQSYGSSFDSFSLVEECIQGDVIDCDQKMNISVDLHEEHPIVLDVIYDRPDPMTDIVTRIELEKRWRQPAPTIHAFDVHIKVTMGTDVHEFSVSPTDCVYNTKNDATYLGNFHIKASLVRDSRIVLVVKADKIKVVTTESPGYIVWVRHVPYEPSASEMQLKVLIKNDGDLTSTYVVTLTDFSGPVIEPPLQQTRTLDEQEEAEITFNLRTSVKFTGAKCLVTMKSPNGKNYDQLWFDFP
jgi:hypothetical protein